MLDSLILSYNSPLIAFFSCTLQVCAFVVRELLVFSSFSNVIPSLTHELFNHVLFLGGRLVL